MLKIPNLPLNAYQIVVSHERGRGLIFDLDMLISIEIKTSHGELVKIF